MSRVVIEGRSLELCRTHAATVVAAMPETFDDLRGLFTGLGGGVGVDLRARPLGGAVERRSPLGRRDPEDRRVFPPRPEGRRLAAGRRVGDPQEG